MRIVTLNCNLATWKLDRKKRIIALIKSLEEIDSNVICLQEIFFQKDAKLIIKQLKSRKYFYYYIKNLLLLSKLPFKNKCYSTFKIQGKLLSYSLLDKLYKKAFQIVKFSHKKDYFFLINTHLLSAKGKNKYHYLETKNAQITEIIEYLNRMGAKKIVLTGDFNFDVNSETYSFVEKFGFYDPMKNILGDTFKNRRLDHFFLKGFEKQQVREKIIFNKKVKINGKIQSISDHYGLELEI